MNKNDVIKALNLEPLDIEGGYFRRTYESNIFLNSERRIGSSIYYLLGLNDISKWHKVACDEIWFYHAGCSAIQELIYPDGRKESIVLGSDLLSGEYPQFCIPANTWQMTRLKPMNKKNSQLSNMEDSQIIIENKRTLSFQNGYDVLQDEYDFGLFSTVVLPEFLYTDFTAQH